MFTLTSIDGSCVTSVYFAASDGLRLGDRILDAGVSHRPFEFIDDRRDETGLSLKGVSVLGMTGKSQGSAIRGALPRMIRVLVAKKDMIILRENLKIFVSQLEWRLT